MKRPLEDADYQYAADLLSCDVPAIKAVAEVESAGKGFLPDDRPTILFERRKFHQFTGGKYSKDHPDISSPKAGGYGPPGDWQYQRMEKAAKLDRTAALRATSWGRFQIMGFNYHAAAYSDVQSFVNGMYESEFRQLLAFIIFIRNAGLDDELREHRWASFAEGYNGKGYRVNEYDSKLARAYKKYGGK